MMEAGGMENVRNLHRNILSPHLRYAIQRPEKRELEKIQLSKDHNVSTAKKSHDSR
jgi:hypothetical protein